MVPDNRADSLFYELSLPQHAVKSAVSAILIPSGSSIYEWSLLFIKRSEYQGVHSGQIAFPGGRCEESDKTIFETACRETFEELGIEPEAIEVVRELSPLYVPPSNYTIYPILYVMSNYSASDIVIDKREVSQTILLPLHSFFNSANLTKYSFVFNGSESTPAPCYQIDQTRIWGATAMIVSEILSIVNRAFPFQHPQG